MPRTKKKVKSIVKTKVISARVTETVHELLHQQAEDAGMTLSEFAAQMLMKGRVNTSYVFYVHPDEIEAITREFAAIGNNLNQIAAFFNSGGIQSRAMLENINHAISCIFEMREIIAEEGLDGFLSIENQVNRDVEAEHAVISPGGSVVYCEEAMKHYKEIGTIVYLHASFEVINSRLKNAKKRGVALRDGQTLKDLYDERVVLFEKYADITVSEDGLELEETIENVMEVLENQ